MEKNKRLLTLKIWLIQNFDLPLHQEIKTDRIIHNLN